MRNDWIQQNRSLMRLYAIVGRIIGWGLLLFAILWLSGIITLLHDRGFTPAAVNTVIKSFFEMGLYYIFVGLIALGVSEVLSVLIDPGYRPGPVLRWAKPILYIFLFFIVIRTVIVYSEYFGLALSKHRPLSEWLNIARQVIPGVLIFIAKLLVIFGLIRLLDFRRLLYPASREDKPTTATWDNS